VVLFDHQKTTFSSNDEITNSCGSFFTLSTDLKKTILRFR
jgi:hypothetical protein